MAAYKSEFLAQRYKGRLHPLHHYVFGFADKLAQWGSRAPGLTNALLTGPITSALIKGIVGIAQQRRLPRLASSSYLKFRPAEPNTSSNHKAESAPQPTGETPPVPSIWERGFPVPPTAQPPIQPPTTDREIEPESAKAQRREAQLAPPQVVLWPDTWNNYYRPQTLVAAEHLLARAGFDVQTPQGHICCGRPLYDFGFLGAARNYLATVLDRMSPQIDAGLPFIFLEPSCASVFKDELLELFPIDPRAQRLSRQIWLLADWLATHAPDICANTLNGTRVLVHGHCHHKAVFGGAANEIDLLRRAGATVEPIQVGCCGMAGPFGFERDKYEISKTIAKDGLLPAVRSAGPSDIVVADGFSCREQIAQLGRKRAVHFAEALIHGSDFET
jgi:Fe-S oxidoreductase